jgi:acyl-coenzyme A thioesterase 13
MRLQNGSLSHLRSLGSLPDRAPDETLVGFAPWSRRSPFGDAAGPLFFRADGDQLTFATRIDERHANASGYAHGGMLSTFADLAMGYAAACSTDPPTPRRTVNLAIDFIAAVALGQVVTATPLVLRVGRLAHVSAVLFVNDAPVARANATLAAV